MKFSDFTLLFADDDAGVRAIYQKAFAKEGFKVVLSTNAAEAMAELSEQKIDLLVTDLEMPKANTFEMFPFLKEKYPNLKVIVVSGHYKGLVDDFISRGYPIAEFVSKPVTLSALKEKIFKALKIEVNAPVK